MKFLVFSAALLLLVFANGSAQERVPWTTARISGSPEPPEPFITEPAFPRFKFREPLELVALPGSDRLVLAEHAGKIFSFRNTPSSEKPDVFADMKQLDKEIQEVFSIAFHPGFLTNRLVFIFYIYKSDLPEGTHISRFKVTDSDPPKLDFSSEKPIITWLSGGHNGGSIRFGKDGYLYIGTGDAAGPNPPDPLDTGQNIGDLLSSILRIDVDHPENGKGYKIPGDNPFIRMANARPEVWAYGLRNPWRMSFDPETGDLWVGDVGWQLWEMIYRIERGGNYGWSLTEGTRQPVRPDRRKGPTPILPPIIEHDHSESASITGGYVYHGKRFPELRGAYVYGDEETGKIWELRYDGKRVTEHREIADTPFKIVSFGEDHQGELYMVDFAGGAVHQLVRNPDPSKPADFPRKLSETGLFGSIYEHRLAPGVRSYSINAEMWSDNMKAARMLGLPGSSQITAAEGKWQFPKDAVLAKTYSLETERGKPKTLRRIETQILHYNGEAWNAYSYRWNADQSDGELIPAAGKEEVFAVKDSSAPGGKRNQTWRFHSRAECLRCHNSWCNTALALDPAQLSDQLTDFVRGGFFTAGCVPSKKAVALVNPYDTGADLATRARSYLHVNCSHCHREHAGGSVLSYMNYDLPLDKAGLLGAKPVQGTFNLTDAQVIAPGQPFHSVLLYRITKTGKGRMPYMGSSLVDERGIELITKWITQLGNNEQCVESAKVAKAGVAELLSSTSTALALACAMASHSVPGSICKGAVEQSSKSANLLVSDLFERFLPDELRRKTLGLAIDPAAILAVKGDASRGRNLFAQEGGAQCATCHRAEGTGREFGPDLTGIGKKYPGGQLLEQILQPSKIIDPNFAGWIAETSDGEVHTGVLVRRTENEIVLRETDSEKHFAIGSVRRFERQQISLMPEGLLQALTAQEAADLLEYLSSL